MQQQETEIITDKDKTFTEEAQKEWDSMIIVLANNAPAQKGLL